MDTMTLYKGAALVGTWWNVVHLRNEDWQLGKTKKKPSVCCVCVRFRSRHVFPVLYSKHNRKIYNNVTGQASD